MICKETSLASKKTFETLKKNDMQKNIHCQTQLGVTQGEWVKRFFGMFWKGNF